MKQRLARLLGGLGPLLIGCTTDEALRRANEQPDDNALTALVQHAQGLATPCQYDPAPSSRQMTVLLAAGEVAVLQDVGGFVKVNEVDCTTQAPAAEVQRILVSGSDGDESVTLDFAAGPLAFPAQGTSGPGIEVSLGAGSGDALDVVLGAEDDRVTLGQQGISIVSAAAPAPDPFSNISASDIELLSIRLGDGDDTLSAGGSAPAGSLLVEGGAGDDWLEGGPGADTLLGGEGRDWLFAGAAPDGPDVLGGGAGLDTVDYSARSAPLVVTMDGVSADDGDASGEADDVRADVENLLGGAGDDVLTGNASNNVIGAGAGADVVSGAAGHDTASYADALSGVSVRLADPASGAPSTGNGAPGENDTLDATIEHLTGGPGDDHLTGNSAPNELVGGAGDDTLVGGAGDDTLEGGPLANAESNRLECGAGDDIAYAEGTGAGAATLGCEL